MTDLPKPTPEHVAAVVAAIKSGSAIVCYAKCWPCQFGQCTDEPHTWMDDDDREHAGIPASTTATELAAAKPCGCHCMAEHRASLATESAAGDTVGSLRATLAAAEANGWQGWMCCEHHENRANGLPCDGACCDDCPHPAAAGADHHAEERS